MATLTTGNWTIARQVGDLRRDTRQSDYSREVDLKLTMASGSYPAGGLTLPGFGSAGMRIRIDRWVLNAPQFTASGSTGSTVSGAIIWTLTTGNKVRPLRVLKATGTGGSVVPLVTGAAVAAQIFYMTAVGY